MLVAAFGMLVGPPHHRDIMSWKLVESLTDLAPVTAIEDYESYMRQL